MIERVAVVWQGPNDIGFIMGVRDRLKCAAQLHKARRRGNKFLARREASKIVKELMFGLRFDLIIRLTDSDDDDWRDVKNQEVQKWPDDVRAQLVCGVAQGSVELWMTTARDYLEDKLGIPADERIAPAVLVRRFKNALRASAPAGNYDELVRKFVTEAPKHVIKTWLSNPSFRDFYVQCRDAATRDPDCRDQIRDELKDEVAN